jgi:hypothetical protein
MPAGLPAFRFEIPIRGLNRLCREFGTIEQTNNQIRKRLYNGFERNIGKSHPGVLREKIFLRRLLGENHGGRD